MTVTFMNKQCEYNFSEMTVGINNKQEINRKRFENKRSLTPETTVILEECKVRRL